MAAAPHVSSMSGESSSRAGTAGEEEDEDGGRPCFPGVGGEQQQGGGRDRARRKTRTVAGTERGGRRGRERKGDREETRTAGQLTLTLTYLWRT